MNKKKILGIALVIVFGIILNIYIFKLANTAVGDKVVVNMNISGDKVNTYQMFPGASDWVEENSSTMPYEKENKYKMFEASIDCSVRNLRIDFGGTPCKNYVKEIFITYKDKRWDISLKNMKKWCSDKTRINDISKAYMHDDVLCVQTDGDDGYAIIDLPNMFKTVSAMRKQSLQIRYGLVAILVDIFLVILLIKFNWCYELVKEVYVNRKLIYRLAKNDFKTKYAGSFFGIFWAFVQPVITILIYWFVFSVGFRSPAEENYPFVLWLSAGLVPWFFFADAWNGATNSLLEYNYLVKKVVFKVSILPIVKVISAVFVSLVFHGILFVLIFCHGIMPNINMIQVLYFMICNITLVLSLSYITCSIIPFFKDLSQIINIILQIGVWATPIMWNIRIMPENMRWIMKINPMYYIVTGYRNSLYGDVLFFQDITWTIYFWGLVGACYVIGNILFKKMRPHFADVI